MNSKIKIQKTAYFLFINAVFAISACNGLIPDGVSFKADFTEFAITSADGRYVDFYMGGDVRKEIASTGEFVPAPNKNYVFMRVPSATVRLATMDNPVRLSLCDPNHDITFGANIYSEGLNLGTEGGIMMTPGVTDYRDRTVHEHRSGDPGVYGSMTVGVFLNGHLYAGVCSSMCLPNYDGSYTNPGICSGTTGHEGGDMSGIDLVEEDPLLSMCMNAEAETPCGGGR